MTAIPALLKDLNASIPLQCVSRLHTDMRADVMELFVITTCVMNGQSVCEQPVETYFTLWKVIPETYFLSHCGGGNSFSIRPYIVTFTVGRQSIT